jgi:adenylate kinase
MLSEKKLRLPKLLIITGTPGTGKSTLAKILAQKLNYERLDLHKHYKELATTYNKQKQCYDLNFKKVLKLVKEKLKTTKKNGIILDSHIAHHLPKSVADLCIVLTCSNLKELQKRLKKRKYSKEKIRENLDAEIFQICLTQAQEKKHKIITFDTSKSLDINKMFLQIRKSSKH